MEKEIEEVYRRLSVYAALSNQDQKELEQQKIPTILIIEPHEVMAHVIEDILREKFHNADIEIAEDFAHKDIDTTLKRKFDIILLDSDLTEWGEHPVYSNWGFNLIPAIKEIRKDTIVIAISKDPEYNEKAIEKGADICFEKRRIKVDLLAHL
jgi:DNA-binding NarL/FixJ family response regulator